MQQYQHQQREREQPNRLVVGVPFQREQKQKQQQRQKQKQQQQSIHSIAVCTTMNVVLLLFIGCIVSFGVGVGVNAYPTGAGSCIGGVPAVTGSQHLNPIAHETIRGGNLNDAGIVVTIVPPTTTTTAASTTSIQLDPLLSTELSTATDYTISVVGTAYEYKGCLIRLEKLSTSDSDSDSDTLDNTDVAIALVPGLYTRSASDVCTAEGTNVVGITHNSSEFKQQHTGILRMEKPSKIQLDVTIVGINNATVSLYAYNNYTITFRNNADDTTVSAAPISSTITTTTAPIVSAPIASTTPVTTAPVTAPASSITTIAPTVAPISTAPDDEIDLKYTKQITDTITNVQVTYKNVDSLQLSDIRTLELICDNWFLNFYNNRSSQVNVPTTTTTNSTNNSTVTRRRLQSTTSTVVVPPPQAFVVRGSMETVINILKQNVSIDVGTGIKSNTITYNQQLSYKIYTSDSPVLPSSMTGTTNYQPLDSLQYTILPYRSVSGNIDLVSALTTKLSTSFGAMESPISVPIVFNDEDGTDNSTTDGDDDDNSINSAVLAGIIIAGVGVLVLVALLIVLVRMNKNNTSTNNHKMSIMANNNSNNNNNSLNNSNNDKDIISASSESPHRPFSSSQQQQQQNQATGITSIVPFGVRRSKQQNRKNNNALNVEEDQSSFDVDSQFTSSQQEQQQPKPNQVSTSFVDTTAQAATTSSSTARRTSAGATLSDGDAAAAAAGQSMNGSSVVHSAGGGVVDGGVHGNGEEYFVYAPKGKLGIVVDNPDDDSGPIIYAIKETSPLLDSLLNVGDRLIMVDEVDVTKMAPSMISKLISRRSGNPMRKLTLRRVCGDNPTELRLAV